MVAVAELCHEVLLDRKLHTGGDVAHLDVALDEIGDAESALTEHFHDTVVALGAVQHCALSQ